MNTYSIKLTQDEFDTLVDIANDHEYFATSTVEGAVLFGIVNQIMIEDANGTFNSTN